MMDAGISVTIGELITLIGVLAVVGPGLFFMGRLTQRVHVTERALCGVRDELKGLRAEMAQHAFFNCPMLKDHDKERIP